MLGTLRQLRIHDILTLGQLLEKGCFYDVALGVTTGSNFVEHFLRYGRGEVSPYIYEQGDLSYFGMLHYPAGGHLARLAHFAPTLLNHADANDLIALLDELTEAAGRAGTYSITAEVNEDAAELEVFRRANFASYARQSIWLREPQPIPEVEDLLEFVPEDARGFAVAYYERFIPPLMRGGEPSVIGARIIYTVPGKDDPSGLILIYNGPRSSLIDIYLEGPERLDVEKILLNALTRVGGYYRNTYLRLRANSGLTTPLLEENGFRHQAEQVVMIRHIATRARQLLKKQAVAIDNGVIPTVPSTHQSD